MSSVIRQTMRQSSRFTAYISTDDAALAAINRAENHEKGTWCRAADPGTYVTPEINIDFAESVYGSHQTFRPSNRSPSPEQEIFQGD